MIPTAPFRKLPLRHLIPCAVLAVVVTVLACWNPFGKPRPVCFNVLMKSSAAGSAAFDSNVDGYGEGMRSPILGHVEGNDRVTHLKFNFAAGRLAALALVPLDKPGVVELQRCWITTSEGDLIADLPPGQATTNEKESATISPDGSLRVQSRPDYPFGSLRFILKTPVEVPSAVSPARAEVVSVFAASLFGFVLLSLSLESRRESFLRLADIAGGWISSRPRSAIALAAGLSVAICLFPVIFAGKSFVSPNNGSILLYGTFPTVPGTDGREIENPAGSDIGATMFWHLPVTALEHRAIFKDGEFPLWNRYGWCGFTLFGQLMSMLGDPLSWPAICTGGAAWAWDLKFVIARFVFACGIGWLVYRTSKSLPAALLLTLSAPFMAFFTYRFCHSANISLCYSPWILIAWCEGAHAKNIRRAALWSGLLIFANWWELNSGTAKEASALIFFLNAAGGFMILFGPQPWRWRATLLALFGWASLVFLLLSAPLWLTFFDALSKSWTIYDAAKVYQMQPGLLIGLFDDIFQRQLVPFEHLCNPSANFFVFLGVLWAVVRIRVLSRDPFFLASLLTGTAVAALAFGVMSPAVAAQIPLLRNILHFDNTFSCVLLTLLFVLAGFGLRECMARLRSPEWKGDWILVMALMGCLLAAYFGLTQAAHRVGYSFIKVGEPLPKSAFFARYVPALIAAFALLPWAYREIKLRRVAGPAWAMAAVCLFAVLHFRHGMYFETKFDLYAANPKQRVDMSKLDSPALAALRQSVSEQPGRVLGIGLVMTPGFNVLLGLESPSSPDALMNTRMLALADSLGLPRVDGWRIGVVPERYPALHRALDLFNVAYTLETPGKAELPGVRRLFVSDLVVGKSETAWPRAFFTNQIATCEDVKDVDRMVKGGDGRPFAALSPQDRPRIPLPEQTVDRVILKAGNYRFTNNTTSFEIDAPSPGMAVLMEANIFGDIWASVDGVETSCAMVDYAFRGVFIGKPGHHVVKFGYWPAILEPALWCGGVGLVCLLLSGWLLVWRRPGDHSEAEAPGGSGIGMVQATANTRDPIVIHP